MIPESHYTSNEKRILQAVAAVNNQISVMVQSLLKVDGAGRIKSTAGNIQRAKQMQKAIMKEMTQGAFKDEMNSLIGTFGKIPDYATEAFQEVRLLPEFGQADDEMVRIMANDTLNEVSAMATQWAGNINSAVYAGAIAGTPRKELLKQAEQLLIGHSDVRGRPMVNYVQTIVNTRIAELDTLMILRKGDELGIERWRYTGSTIRDSREWCVDHAGKIFTKEEIEEWRDKKWNGKKAGDPFVTRGGWNCRHGFSPVLVEAEEKVIEGKPEGGQKTQEAKKPVKAKAKPAAKGKTLSRRQMLSELKQDIAKNDADIRYPDDDNDGLPFVRFNHTSGAKRVTRTQKNRAGRRLYGNAELNGMNDEAAAIVHGELGTLNALADRYNVPRLRAMRTMEQRGVGASMGDGVLSMNRRTFNGRAIPRTAEQAADDMAKLKLQLDESREAIRTGRDAAAAGGSAAIKEFNDKIKKHNKLADTINEINQTIDLPVSNWLPDDRSRIRPYTASGYHDNGVDQIRSTLLHELGHHVHQQYAVSASAYQSNSPYVEGVIARLFRTKKARVSATEYGDQDADEWFAEGFAMFHNNLEHLVEPELKELFHKIEKGLPL